MSTATLNYNNPPNLIKLLLLIAMLAVGWGGVKLATHAVARHGSEAETIRKCLENSNGPMRVFKNRWNEFFLLCQLNDGRWGWQIVNEQGYEKSAYVKGDGVWKSLQDWLIRNNVTPYKGPLPWVSP